MPEPTPEEIAAAETAKAEQAAKEKADADAKAKAESEIKFTDAQQAAIDRIVETRLNQQRAQHKKQQDDAKAAADAQKLAEQGEFKALADQRAARILELETELETGKQNTLRATIAAKHKLPELFIPLIQGTNEAEMDEHAKALAATVAPPRAPAGEGGPARPNSAGTWTVDQAKEDMLKTGHGRRF